MDFEILYVAGLMALSLFTGIFIAPFVGGFSSECGKDCWKRLKKRYSDIRLKKQKENYEKEREAKSQEDANEFEKELSKTINDYNQSTHSDDKNIAISCLHTLSLTKACLLPLISEDSLINLVDVLASVLKDLKPPEKIYSLEAIRHILLHFQKNTEKHSKIVDKIFPKLEKLFVIPTPLDPRRYQKMFIETLGETDERAIPFLLKLVDPEKEPKENYELISSTLSNVFNHSYIAQNMRDTLIEELRELRKKTPETDTETNERITYLLKSAMKV